jgi:hypothetical protein
MNELVEALGLEELELEEQEEVLLKFGELLFRDSLIRFISALPEEKREAFAALIEKNASPDEIGEYVSQNVPEADRLVGEALNDLTDDILAVTEKA